MCSNPNDPDDERRTATSSLEDDARRANAIDTDPAERPSSSTRRRPRVFLFAEDLSYRGDGLLAAIIANGYRAAARTRGSGAEVVLIANEGAATNSTFGGNPLVEGIERLSHSLPIGAQWDRFTARRIARRLGPRQGDIAHVISSSWASSGPTLERALLVPCLTTRGATRGSELLVTHGAKEHRIPLAVPNPGLSTLERSTVLAVGSFGPLQTERHLRCVIEAYAMTWPPNTSEARPRLLLIGSGPDHADVWKRINTHGLMSEAVVGEFSGPLDHLLRLLDVAVQLDPTTESATASLLCLAAGRPLIVQRDHPLAEDLVRADAGIVIENHSPEALATALGRLRDLSLRQRISSAATDFATRVPVEEMMDGIITAHGATSGQLSIP